jgi:hypothetical protein
MRHVSGHDMCLQRQLHECLEVKGRTTERLRSNIKTVLADTEFATLG